MVIEDLREEVKRFLEVTGMPKSRFARNIGVTHTSLNRWLNEERRFSDKRIPMIIEYMRWIKRQLY